VHEGGDRTTLPVPSPVSVDTAVLGRTATAPDRIDRALGIRAPGAHFLGSLTDVRPAPERFQAAAVRQTAPFTRCTAAPAGRGGRCRLAWGRRRRLLALQHRLPPHHNRHISSWLHDGGASGCREVARWRGADTRGGTLKCRENAQPPSLSALFLLPPPGFLLPHPLPHIPTQLTIPIKCTAYVPFSCCPVSLTWHLSLIPTNTQLVHTWPAYASSWVCLFVCLERALYLSI